MDSRIPNLALSKHLAHVMTQLDAIKNIHLEKCLECSLLGPETTPCSEWAILKNIKPETETKQTPSEAGPLARSDLKREATRSL
jgi:hypothetical protein